MTINAASGILSPPPLTIDHHGLDWSTVRSTAYVIHQRFRYEYTGPVAHLRQRLVIIPRPRHGDQRLVTHRFDVSVPAVDERRTVDEFGNIVLDLTVPYVERAIDFTAEISVSRARSQEVMPDVVKPSGLRPWQTHSRLAHPDDSLHAAAAALRETRATTLELAHDINRWVFREMRYTPGVTGVSTTAADAFALRAGVCQDYAHVMLALCRLCNLPARYVSGHLLGEGGTHAWVEVLCADPLRPNQWIAHAFDPTHGCETDFRYITVAIGRDYSDVPPTSGSYVSAFSGVLSASKSAAVSAIELN